MDMKKSTAAIIIYLFAIMPYLLAHEQISRRISEPGHYTGRVLHNTILCQSGPVDKYPIRKEPCFYALKVKWDHSGESSVIMARNERIYNDAVAYEIYESEAIYTWWGGAVELYAVPELKRLPYLMAASIFRVITLLLFLYLGCNAIFRGFTTWRQRVVPDTAV